ncbi:MAG: rhomboid family intramembrane serine protease [Oscillospiraceae bacterium]
MRWIDKLDRKIGRFSIPNLMLIVSTGMFVVYLFSMLFPEKNLMSYLTLNMAAVANGEIWRLLTFIILPPQSSIFFILFALYFYVIIGSSLEKEWGSFKFNVFYLFGIVGTIVAALISGGSDNIFLNLSLFLAFAILFPNHEILLFFILPIKVKYLAILDAIFFGISLILGTWQVRAAIIASLVNIIIFFGGDFYRFIKNKVRNEKWRRDSKITMTKK